MEDEQTKTKTNLYSFARCRLAAGLSVTFVTLRRRASILDNKNNTHKMKQNFLYSVIGYWGILLFFPLLFLYSEPLGCYKFLPTAMQYKCTRVRYGSKAIGMQLIYTFIFSVLVKNRKGYCWEKWATMNNTISKNLQFFVFTLSVCFGVYLFGTRMQSAETAAYVSLYNVIMFLYVLLGGLVLGDALVGGGVEGEGEGEGEGGGGKEEGGLEMFEKVKEKEEEEDDNARQLSTVHIGTLL